jgi:2-phospho-L-lactate/phosphoenolpyruvate guanylyltransferase
MSLWLLIPVKPFAEGKLRLSTLLDTGERRRLNERFFSHTLSVAQRFPGVERTAIVSACPEAARMALGLGAHYVAEGAELDLNHALERAREFVVQRGATALLIVPCDLPWLTAEDLRHMAELGGLSNQVVIAQNSAGSGTNAMYLPADAALRFCFGPDSCEKHLAAARAAKVSASVEKLPRLAFDVDTPEDYLFMIAKEAQPRIELP